METVKFNKNWNEKLCCDHFTTIRLHSPKFHVGNILKTVCRMTRPDKKVVEIEDMAMVVYVKEYRLNDIPEEVFWTDCGMCKRSAIDMIEKMYMRYNINIHTAKWDVVVLKHYYGPKEAETKHN